MAGDSGDSDIELRPSCSKSRRTTRGNANHGGGNCTESRKGRKRRIVMRIEFDDSDDDSSSPTEASSDDGKVENMNIANDSPSCSTRARRTRRTTKSLKKDESDESDDVQRNMSKRLRNRRTNMLYMDGSDSDGSSSGSEIDRSVKTRASKSSKKILTSEDEQTISYDEAANKESNKQKDATESGFNSDSSSNELLEKCPICLLTFRQQEIGSPATCAHIFCASCIEAWSKNVQTCPIDRIEFDRIIVRENHENRRIVREINVDPNKINKELLFEEEEGPAEEDITYCEICNSPDREDVMLLCDECNQGYHMDCLEPRLNQIPEGSWYCDNCFDPSAESDNVSEDLNLLYEDIRDMGIPQAAFRVTELQQPRILRTRQNERIRAAVLRTTRSRAARIETTTTTTTSAGTSRARGRPRGSTTTTTTTTTTRTTRAASTRRKPGRRRRRRRHTRRRTYVVEYDLNNFDEKFAIKTTKKIMRRRRRKRRATACNALRTSTGERMTASKRLAEQMGVKKDPTFTSHLSGTSAGLSLFGGANDLEYFSDSDNGGIEHEIQLESGHGTAVQTSIRISNFGSQRARKGILLGRLQSNNRRNVIPDLPAQTNAPAGGDLLSSIMDIQDRWHKAARHMENVRINSDGTLQLPTGTNSADSSNVSANASLDARQTPTSRTGSATEQPNTPINPLDGVTQAPIYSRGGGNQSFGGGGGSGGGGGGNYNNRYNNNQNNYRGGGGGQYRHSTGSDGGGNSSNSMGGRGNFNFSNQNFNNSNNNPNPNFSPFTMRFNQRNNNQRNSLPFMNRNDDERQQHQQQQQQQHNQQQNTTNDCNNPFSGLPPSQQQIPPNENPLFGDLPPPVMGAQPVCMSGPPPMSGPPQMSGPPLMAGHPPMSGPPQMSGPPNMSGPPPMAGPPHMSGPPPIMGPLPMAGPPPQTMGMSGPPPSLAMHSPMQSIRPLMTVPPPPAPPPGVPMPWATPIFQQLNNDYGNDDDDSNCPNFSVYSAESQEVAKSTEMPAQTQQEDEAAKEDDENEDLVQLDDDDEIPMPPETSADQSTAVKESDLYEPENPTEENDDDDEELEEEEEQEQEEEETEHLRKDDVDENKDKNVEVEKADENDEISAETASPEHAKRDDTTDNGDSQYDPEHEILSNEGSNMELESIEEENVNESSKSNNEATENERERSEDRSVHTPSPAVSVTKLPETDLGTANKKGVLELYDDSDWEELEIDKPKEYEKAAQAAENPEKSELEEGQLEDEPEKEKERRKKSKDKDKGKEDDEKDEGEQDRSYTPCLDENNEPEEGTENGQVDQAGTKSLNTSKGTNADQEEEDGESGKTPELIVSEPAVIETELISDDDDNNARAAKKRRSSKKREKRDKKVETFKKVSNKQKGRNYRTDKQLENKHKGRRRISKSRSRSRSRSRSKSRSKSRTRTPTRSRSRIRSRSRSRSPRPLASRSRSPSYPPKSRSRSPRGRGRRRSRSRSLRSRSRSNNKENHWRPGNRFQNNMNHNKFYDRNNRFNQNQYRPKRREMPRYNVRNVVGLQRNFRDGERREVRDRYGRDTTRQVRNFSRSPSPRDRRMGVRSSFSRSRSRGRSMSPRRNRRGSFSMSPSPQPMMQRHSLSPRQRYHSPRRHSLSPRRLTPMRARSRTPLRMRSRSLTPPRMGGRKVMRRVRGSSPLPQPVVSRSPSRLRSMSASPRYTPRLHRSRSKTPIMRVAKGKKKKLKEKGKKKKKKRLPILSPDTNIRISRQRDAFEVDRPPKKKRRHSPKQKAPIEEPTWSPSPSPPPVLDYERENNISWTPPILSPRLVHEMHGIYEPEPRRSTSPSKRDKRKRIKKKKKGEKRREVRKEKRRIRRTQTPDPIPSKEVFASGNNILVSVSFNKDAAGNPQPSQTTVVTVPATREDLHNRRNSIDVMALSAANKKKKKRKKLDTKPVAIIDLERSPFQVHQEPADVIVLTDSEEGAGGHDSEHDHDHEHHEHEHERRRESHRERRRSASIAEEMDHHRSQMSNGIRSSSQLDKTPPLERERLETILEESYDLPQTGPKTPPEPPTVKFTMPAKKQSKTRSNPLHDETELNSESEMAEVREPDTHRSELEPMHGQSNQKIGPNTPPESGPCSPDAYDPFDPTKSPSISPRSPSPAPMNNSQDSIGADSVVEVVPTQKHIVDEQRLPSERNATTTQITGTGSSMTAQGPTLNPVELVMKLMNTKQNSSQDLSKTNEPQYSTATHMHSNILGNAHDDGLGMRDKADEPIGLVISNVLLSNGNTQASQHIPVISSPTPIMKSSQISKLPLPKVGSSVGSSSGAGLPLPNVRNGIIDDAVNLTEMESPYSPGSADYEDLFEPPPEISGAARRSKRGGKMDVFDNLFGSTSPIGYARMPKKFKAIVTSSGKKSKIKVSKADDHIKVYDDLPNSAVELQVKDKFLRKLNRQERVVEEVKLVLKPRFNKKQITKDDYKEIMRRAVPKICHSRSGEINPHKIKNLIDAYVRKFRAKHKKLNLLNTGQVSSAVKCAAYLKKL